MTTDLRKYMHDLGEVIGYTLTSEGYGARLLRAKQGPLTLSYRLQLLRPKQGDIERVLRLGPLLESNTGLGPFRISRDVGSIIIEVPSPDPVTPHASLLAHHTRGRNICIGFDRWGEPVFLSLPRFPNILVSGPPRSGKTSAMRSMVYSVLRTANSESEVKVEVAFCAEKVEFWSPFELVQGFAGFFTNKREISKFLAEVDGEMKALAASKQHYNPAKIIVLDDLLGILSNNSEVVPYISSLVSVGGSVGLYVLIGTQSVGSKAGTGGQQVEDNIVARLLYRTSSRSAAARATGEGGEGLTELTTQPGDALWVAGHDHIRIATGYVDNDDITKDLPRRTRRPRYMHFGNTPQQESSGGGQEVTHRPPPTNLLRMAPELPKVKPARELTEGEAVQVLEYLRYKAEKGEKISKNSVLFGIFGNKNPKYVKYLMDALGAEGPVYFPTKEKQL